MTTDFPPQLPSDSPGVAAPFGGTPAASVIAECLRVQSEAPPRSAFARILGRSPLSEDSHPWYVGALGELEVARRLEALGDGWTVVHSVPIGTRGSDIDHVVVGPPGVFTLNTKHHAGAKVWVGGRRLLVNGQKTEHLRNTRHEAPRTQKLLSSALGADVPVRGVIVVVGAKQITVREQPADVAVLASPQLVRWLKKQKPALDAALGATVAAAVCAKETWTGQPQPMADTAGFAQLRREVESARRVRMLWGGAVLVGILGVSVPLAIGYYARLFGG